GLALGGGAGRGRVPAGPGPGDRSPPLQPNARVIPRPPFGATPTAPLPVGPAGGPLRWRSAAAARRPPAGPLGAGRGPPDRRSRGNSLAAEQNPTLAVSVPGRLTVAAGRETDPGVSQLTSVW